MFMNELDQASGDEKVRGREEVVSFLCPHSHPGFGAFVSLFSLRVNLFLEGDPGMTCFKIDF